MKPLASASGASRTEYLAVTFSAQRCFSPSRDAWAASSVGASHTLFQKGRNRRMSVSSTSGDVASPCASRKYLPATTMSIEPRRLAPDRRPAPASAARRARRSGVFVGNRASSSCVKESEGTDSAATSIGLNDFSSQTDCVEPSLKTMRTNRLGERARRAAPFTLSCTLNWTGCALENTTVGVPFQVTGAAVTNASTARALTWSPGPCGADTDRLCVTAAATGAGVAAGVAVPASGTC